MWLRGLDLNWETNSGPIPHGGIVRNISAFEHVRKQGLADNITQSCLGSPAYRALVRLLRITLTTRFGFADWLLSAAGDRTTVKRLLQ